VRSAAALVLGFVLGAGAVWFLRPGPAPCVAGLTLADALLNAGSTDYVFTLPSGAVLTLRAEHGSPDAAAFEGFLLPATDGPAEADPARIGQSHRVCFDTPLKVSGEDAG
jgi:hypothetical protein